jgi:glutathione S-transferase
MTIQVSAFRWVPSFAQGFVRDLRVRWALEEAGLDYEESLVGPETKVSDAYRRWQPFLQVPAYRDDQVEMFESGAIVLHIAEKSPSLAPSDPAGRANVSAWTIAALNSIEPHVANYASTPVFYAGQPWVEGFRAAMRPNLEKRLSSLSNVLDGRDWLVGDRFTAADIVMVTVLRELVDCGVLAGYPVLDAYRQRGEARPAFARAMEAQLSTFRAHAPKDA